MLSFAVALFIGTALGFLAGMGVGGGSLLLLWLTQVVMLEPPQAKILNLLFYLPSALTATLYNIKRGSVDKKIVIPGLITGCLSAAAASYIAKTLDVQLAKRLLGGLLIIVGMRELFYRPRKAR